MAEKVKGTNMYINVGFLISDIQKCIKKEEPKLL